MTFKKLFSKHYRKKVRIDNKLNEIKDISSFFAVVFNTTLLIIFGGYIIPKLFNNPFALLVFASIFLFFLFKFLFNFKGSLYFYLKIFRKNKLLIRFKNFDTMPGSDFNENFICQKIINEIKKMEFNELLKNKEIILNRSSNLPINERKEIYDTFEKSLDFFENQKERIIQKGNKEPINKKIVQQL